ncbi:MAG: hypothetical protein PWQ19_789 [Tepidiphilus sp.]|nr:hypothetical protein [Tepidiphilus sp.]
MIRRVFMGLALSFLATSSFASGKEFAEESPLVKVWKSPYCGCCKEWIAHMQANGFQVQTFEVGNSEVRSRLGMPMRYGSCHTAVVQGYVIEGHVPAADVKRLLAEKPNALGLAVPGMPIGSPGMDGVAYGGRRDAYKVLLVGKDGAAQVFGSYP